MLLIFMKLWQKIKSQVLLFSTELVFSILIYSVLKGGRNDEHPTVSQYMLCISHQPLFMNIPRELVCYSLASIVVNLWFGALISMTDLQKRGLSHFFATRSLNRQFRPKASACCHFQLSGVAFKPSEAWTLQMNGSCESHLLLKGAKLCSEVLHIIDFYI